MVQYWLSYLGFTTPAAVAITKTNNFKVFALRVVYIHVLLVTEFAPLPALQVDCGKASLAWRYFHTVGLWLQLQLQLLTNASLPVYLAIINWLMSYTTRAHTQPMLPIFYLHNSYSTYHLWPAQPIFNLHHPSDHQETLNLVSSYQ